MTIKKSFKQTALFSIGTLALAVASASHGVDFEVGDTKASVYGYAKLDMMIWATSSLTMQSLKTA